MQKGRKSAFAGSEARTPMLSYSSTEIMAIFLLMSLILSIFALVSIFRKNEYEING